MKKLVYLFLIIIILVPKQSKAQDGAAAAGIAVAALAIGSGIAAAERMKEQAELKATEWILANKPELNSFYVSTLDFNSKKAKDLSSVSVITFRIREFGLNGLGVVEIKFMIMVTNMCYMHLQARGGLMNTA